MGSAGKAEGNTKVKQEEEWDQRHRERYSRLSAVFRSVLDNCFAYALVAALLGSLASGMWALLTDRQTQAAVYEGQGDIPLWAGAQRGERHKSWRFMIFRKYENDSD